MTPGRRTALALVTLVIAATATAAAQQAHVRRDSARAEIHRTLRAFYFNLAHNDWEALTADILPAKAVAHRSPPEVLATAAPSAGGAPAECRSPGTPSIVEATITLDGDWAEVSVPRCTEPSGEDKFRLIRFERRWRFVHIDLLPAGGLMGLSYKPNGYNAVSPYLIVDGASGTITFLKQVFGAVELRRFPDAAGKLMHAEVRIDDTVVMIADGGENWPPVPSNVHVYVSDVDATYRQALAAGATSVQEPVKKQDEDKRGGVKDAGGTTWWIATRVE